ncbi:fused signal recognition particle receptor [Desulfosarcina sp. BuS5]|uniref:signal recognition particle-docking protein FtsY n=1 Tax=Desulfosarcina sp. BuS5 TaxID=933262 RepID=UPI000484AAD2|nr:signal recognition particle-docking protein FtsY [Desulfosarcina sp. BuS5]WDN89944.1 fused signal recognition particle receptor [Desulfosarcina sp. BuS5]
MAFNWFKKKKKQPREEVETGEVVAGQEDNSENEEVDSAITEIEDTEIEEQPDEETVDGVEDFEEKQNIQEVEEIEELQESGKTRNRAGFFGRLKKGLAKTREIFTTDIDDLFTGKRKLDDDMLEELEELLITSDIGVQASMDILENISQKSFKISGADQLKEILNEEILALFESKEDTANIVQGKPHVVMVIGVNGVGKTTTIGKLASKSAGSGKKVLIAAADTFRAAAIEQLEIWANRAGADIIKHKDNSDPAAVAYDSIEAALARDADIVFVDTAGRLHTKVNLMEELKKIKRALAKKIPEAPHEILLVLDATTGQNALSQAEMFNDALGITGVVITKLDGTAKGGVVISICSTLDIPLLYIGVGETIDDLDVFKPKDYVNALF